MGRSIVALPLFSLRKELERNAALVKADIKQ